MPHPEVSATPGEAPIDRPERTGNAWLVLFLAISVVAAAFAFSFLEENQSHPIVLGLMALLSVIGFVALFGWSAGLFELTGRSRRFDLTKRIVDDGPDGMLVTDAAGRVVYANAAYLTLTGADGPRDVRTLDRVWAGAPDVAEAIYRLTHGVDEGRRAAEEIRIRPSEGGPVRWLRLRARPVQGTGSRQTLWTVSDVTRERERQENIVQELQLAIDYLDHAPAGFFSLDPDGSIAYMNATLAALLDRDLGESATGRLKLADFVPAELTALFRGGAAKPGEVATKVFDIDVLARSGRSRPVRVYHRVPYAADGTPGASRTLVVDRTAEGRGDDPLRAVELRLARFFNSAPMAIATVDQAGLVLDGNAAFARLLPDLPSRGGALVQGVIEKDRQPLLDALQLAREGRAVIEPVDVGLAGEGQRQGRFYLAAVTDPGAHEAAVVFAIDTTQQAQLEQQLRQSMKMNAVGQLAGGIAHDFNNVLTAIIGHADILLANHRPADPSFQDIMRIKHSANRAADLVHQLLAFSRRQTLRPQVLHLTDTLPEIISMLNRTIGERVQVQIRHGRDLWPIRADYSQFEQVVINLAVNARDAMPDGGRLIITTSNVEARDVPVDVFPALPRADYVEIAVSDTGGGIPPEIQEKIFEPFFTTKEIGKGTGLGLSTVYGIVKQTGGFIFVVSQPGEGATFRIFLPRHVPDPAQPVSVPAPEAAKPASTDLTGHGTVLLVEDEEAVRAFAARALTSRGYKVIEACTGVEALDRMREHGARIDLIVTDVVMPEMDGPALVREVRRTRPELPIVFMSGYAEEAFRKDLENDDSFRFLPKPFSLKQLAQTVKDALPR